MIEDVLCISLTINSCILTHIIIKFLLKSSKATSKVKYRLSRCLSSATKEFDKSLDAEIASMLARKCVNQLTTWVLCCAAIYILSSYPVLSSPFSSHGLSEESRHVIKIFFSVNVGRYCYRVISLWFTKPTSAPIKEFVPSCLTHCLTLFSYVTMVLTQENTLLGVVGMITEITSVFNLYQCLQNLGCESLSTPAESNNRRCSVIWLIVEFTSTALVKIISPAVLIAFSAKRMSPLTMSMLSIIVFFLIIAYYTGTTCWKLLSVVKSILDLVWMKKQPGSVNSFSCGSPQKSRVVSVDPDLVVGLPNTVVSSCSDVDNYGTSETMQKQPETGHHNTQQHRSTRGHSVKSQTTSFKKNFEKCRLEIITEEH